jgi:hypothetical protein
MYLQNELEMHMTRVTHPTRYIGVIFIFSPQQWNTGVNVTNIYRNVYIILRQVIRCTNSVRCVIGKT